MAKLLDCPDCGAELIPENDEERAYCEDCGFVLYTSYDLELMGQAKMEFEQAKADCYPETVPDDYNSREAVNERLVEAWRLKQ